MAVVFFDQIQSCYGDFLLISAKTLIIYFVFSFTARYSNTQMQFRADAEIHHDRP
jgi:putative copper export protein